jgi:hypothetical protein
MTDREDDYTSSQLKYTILPEPTPEWHARQLKETGQARWLEGDSRQIVGPLARLAVSGFRRLFGADRADTDSPLNKRELRRLERQGALEAMSYHVYHAIADTKAFASSDIEHPEKLLQRYTASQFELIGGRKFKTAEGSAYVGIDPTLVQPFLSPGIDVGPGSNIQAGLFVPLEEPQDVRELSLSREPKMPDYDRRSGYKKVGIEVFDVKGERDWGYDVLFAETYTEGSISRLTNDQRIELLAMSNKIRLGADRLRREGPTNQL